MSKKPEKMAPVMKDVYDPDDLEHVSTETLGTRMNELEYEIGVLQDEWDAASFEFDKRP